MSNMDCVLKLEKLEFDNIEFKRKGPKNDKEFEVGIRVEVSQNIHRELYRILLGFDGKKEGEYELKIDLYGYFSYDDSANLDEETKNVLLRENAVAIMMPYIRSELSILTAQPEMDCVVLPPFNITNLLQ